MQDENEGELVSNRFANPKTIPAPRGYTQVVETTGPGRTIYLWGQLGMPPGDVTASHYVALCAARHDGRRRLRGRARRFSRAGNPVLRELESGTGLGRRWL